MKLLFDEFTEDSAPPLAQRHGSPYPAMIAAATLVVIMLCAAGFTIWHLHQRVIGETRASLAKLALVVAEHTSRSFQQVDLSLQEIADHVAQSGLDATSMRGELLQQFLAERMRGLQQVKNLNIADENGQLINHALSWPAPDLDLSAREHFRYLRDHAMP